VLQDVPILLTPVVLRSYAGTCGFALPEKVQTVLREQETSSRQYHLVNDLRPFLNAEKKKYIHLVDGGVADNLGLRQALDRVTLFGTLWNTLQYAGLENIHKVAFIVVDAETEVTKSLNLFGKPPAFAAMLNSYSSIAITRYNYETVMLLRENFRRWTEEVQKGRCGNCRGPAEIPTWDQKNSPVRTKLIPHLGPE